MTILKQIWDHFAKRSLNKSFLFSAKKLTWLMSHWFSFALKSTCLGQQVFRGSWLQHLTFGYSVSLWIFGVLPRSEDDQGAVEADATGSKEKSTMLIKSFMFSQIVLVLVFAGKVHADVFTSPINLFNLFSANLKIVRAIETLPLTRLALFQK